MEIFTLKHPHPSVSSKIVWAAFDGGDSRTGVNNFETIISPANVNSLKLLWQKTLPYKTNGTPAEVPNVNTSSGVKDLIFITTQKERDTILIVELLYIIRNKFS